MPFPADITLPASAKYFSFVDYKKYYNPDYDITWSFQYAISGNNNQAAFCTFLTSTPLSSLIGALPGQYLGYSGSVPFSAYLLTESGDFLLTEDYTKIILEGNAGIATPNGFCIAFDTTGLFALSSAARQGVGINSIKPNSLILRDPADRVTYYEELSNIDSRFSILSSVKEYKTMRFRYANADVLHIDYKLENDSTFTTLTSLRLPTDPDNFPYLHAGFSYCSPISSTAGPAKLFLKNFHIQGTEQPTITETIPFNKLTL